MAYDGWHRALIESRRAKADSTAHAEPTPDWRARLRGASYEEGAAELSPGRRSAREGGRQGEIMCLESTNVSTPVEETNPHAIEPAQMASILSAMDAQSLDPGAIKGLQAYLAGETEQSVRVTGIYDLETARAVYDLDGGTGGIVGPDFFAERGLFYFQRGGELIPPAFGDIAARHSDGLTISLYADYGNRHQGAEFRARAAEHAGLYSSVGADSGAAVLGVAVPIGDVSEVPQRIRQIARAVEASWERMVAELQDHLSLNLTNFSKPKSCKVKNIALFSHGMHYGLAMNQANSYDRGLTDGRAGRRPSNVRGLALSVADVLTDDVQVQLFACNAGNSHSQDGNWHQPTEGHQGGEDSYAAKLTEALDATGKRSTVFAHITAGHTTENVSARVFGAQAQSVVGSGESASLFEVVFPPTFVAEQAEAKGWTVDRTRDELWNFFKRQIYRGSAPRGNEGMQLFTDVEEKRDEFQDRFEESYS